MPLNTSLTTDNIMDLSLDEIRKICFGVVPTHHEATVIDTEEYTRLLGLYPALYQYFSEIFVHLIACVRKFSQAKNTINKLKAQDRKDCLEQVLKVIKFEYDGLSRKTTVLSMESENG